MDLHLSVKEEAELGLLLDSALSDFSYEIADTYSWDYRKRLRDRRECLMAIRRQLELARAEG